MRSRVHLFLLPALGFLLALGIFVPPAERTVYSRPLSNNVLARALDVELGRAPATKARQPLSSGVMYTLLEASGELARRAAAVSTPASQELASEALSQAATQGCQHAFLNAHGKPVNIRVNQDCSRRRQAEEVIAINPTDPQNLIAGQNDNRIGFNHCGYGWSLDGGKTWGDQTPPFYGFLLADGHSADACSDPTVTFDASGNAYIAGVLFDVNSDASAVVVAKSNAAFKGTFFHSPDPSGGFQTFSATPLGVVANDNDANILNDKEFLVADANPGSPRQGNVYLTWTRFAMDTGAGVTANSPIYFSQSSDGGKTWSPGIAISGANAALCGIQSGSTNPNACDQDQGSVPVVGPDGTLYVAFNNSNTPLPGLDQQLLVSCPARKDCTQAANWTTPVKIADDVNAQPRGSTTTELTTGCPNGRPCLPPNGYRLNDFGALAVDSSSTLYFVWSDFRNGGGSCPQNGSAATATPPCNNDVFYTFSTDRGATWSPAINVTAAPQFGPTAQWQAWADVAADGSTLFIAFYDRHYGECETTGCNDITLAKVSNPASATPSVAYTRVTTSSMPNLDVASNPTQAGFLGDYLWVDVNAKGRAYIVWADTRGVGGATPEEDIYSAKKR
jgi:hypothetical protein